MYYGHCMCVCYHTTCMYCDPDACISFLFYSSFPHVRSCIFQMRRTYWEYSMNGYMEHRLWNFVLPMLATISFALAMSDLRFGIWSRRAPCSDRRCVLQTFQRWSPHFGTKLMNTVWCCARVIIVSIMAIPHACITTEHNTIHARMCISFRRFLVYCAACMCLFVAHATLVLWSWHMRVQLSDCIIIL